MLITIDTAMAAVYQSGGLLDVAMQVANVRSVRDLSFTSTRDPVCRKLEAHFKNRLIKTRTTSDRTKTIYAIVPGPIGNYPFQKDGVPTTIEVRLLNPRLDQTNHGQKRYLYQAYGITLTYPKAFGVRISGRTAPFPVIVPAELCKVLPGQLYKKKIPSAATKDAVQFATMAPQLRFQTITGGTTAGIQSPVSKFPLPRSVCLKCFLDSRVSKFRVHCRCRNGHRPKPPHTEGKVTLRS